MTYELRDGELRQLGAYTLDPESPRTLTTWLDSVVTVAPALIPTPESIRVELGRESIAFHRAMGRLTAAWSEVRKRPEAALKRDLWQSFLQHVYGTSVGADELFLQHTYLTIIAKALATRLLGAHPASAASLLSGEVFSDAGVTGAVESDFFDWPLLAEDGDDLTARILRLAERFQLKSVQADILKALYESLIDPEQRHDLGEYYTPDWLASWMCDQVLTSPLTQRVLDPACGSGTFLFHAVRRVLAAADANGMSNRDAIRLVAEKVVGVDVHPVAVLFARVTYLLAIGRDRLQERPPITVPVYLGDSLQWNTEAFLADREVLIEVPGGPVLSFPFSITRSPSLFDSIIDGMQRFAQEGANAGAFAAWLLGTSDLTPQDVAQLTSTYSELAALHAQNRDHIWGYVARNLSRPIWLSTTEQKADVVIGNPPWLSYRSMTASMQRRFRKESQARGVWTGGPHATTQDLSGYFFAKVVELYLRPGGRIAFVMPYATLISEGYSGFRTGRFGRLKNPALASVCFDSVWTFDERVQPLFPVPACVLFATDGDAGAVPKAVRAFKGRLPRRDASSSEALASLTAQEIIGDPSSRSAAGYADQFRQGAAFSPRMLTVVEPVTASWLGANPDLPIVRSRRSNLKKPPWINVPALEGPVEAQYLRRLYLGESIAPFRALRPAIAVVPWHADTRVLIDSSEALALGFLHVSRWLADAEAVWEKHQRSSLSLVQQLDYYGKLTTQLTSPSKKLVYASSGSQPAAALITDSSAVCDMSLYWAPLDDLDEGRYLLAILNSEIARTMVERRQARGQWGARHFAKLLAELPIPSFSRGDPLHMELAANAATAEQVAKEVPAEEGAYFVRVRERIRKALAADGVAQRMEALVQVVLGVDA